MTIESRRGMALEIMDRFTGSRGIATEIIAEVFEAHDKHGGIGSSFLALSLLMEELGEAADAVLMPELCREVDAHREKLRELSHPEMRRELIQIAGLAITAIAEMDGRDGELPEASTDPKLRRMARRMALLGDEARDAHRDTHEVPAADAPAYLSLPRFQPMSWDLSRCPECDCEDAGCMVTIVDEFNDTIIGSIGCRYAVSCECCVLGRRDDTNP